MIDKIKTLLAIILVVMVIFAIGYSIVKSVTLTFKQPDLVTKSNLKEYVSDENLVIGYSVYYYYEDCVINFFEACNKELYEELYNIYIKDYAKVHGKEEVITQLKEVKEKITPKDMDEEIKYGLSNLYTFEDAYIAEVYINEDVFFIVFDHSDMKELDYSFAFVK